MNKTCARCDKTVYPTEELKCLDKVWHKGCFKCQECGMTLNMRTYKGYGKLPYCEAHVPKAKHTTMAETPELKRIAENTKLQSNVKYHADFEKSKGKFTQVADDPETLRIKANTKIISNVAYHGDLEKKAQMEKQRHMNENGDIVETTDNYHQQIESYATEMLPPPTLPAKNHYQEPAQYQNRQYQDKQYTNNQPQYQEKHNTNNQPPYQEKQYTPQQYTHTEKAYAHQEKSYTQQEKTYAPQEKSYAPQEKTYTHQEKTYANQDRSYGHQERSFAQQEKQYQEKQYAQNTQPQYHQEQYYKPKYDDYQYQYQYDPQQYQNYQNAGAPNQQQKIGRIQDYDPLVDGPRPPPNTQRASSTLIYNSNNDNRGAHHSMGQQQHQQGRQIGRVTDLDPLANEQPRAPVNHHTQKVYIAMYDYEANDQDEVSFVEGDLISNVTSVDEGWMTGQVLRTGKTGMLPANYVDLAPAGALTQY